MLKVGQLAPDFTLLDQEGKSHSLVQYLGKWVLLYFYPKDDTPGCTKEACMIRDTWAEFAFLNAEVLGVSTDSVKSHEKFATKYNLSFPILADDKKEVVEKYGVWGKKKFMGNGRASTDTARHDSAESGTLRTSFLIDPKGTIAKIYENVKPEIHAGEVLEDLKKSNV